MPRSISHKPFRKLAIAGEVLLALAVLVSLAYLCYLLIDATAQAFWH
jgi:hypothetical protein